LINKGAIYKYYGISGKISHKKGKEEYMQKPFIVNLKEEITLLILNGYKYEHFSREFGEIDLQNHYNMR